jgi:hypothetical protein
VALRLLHDVDGVLGAQHVEQAVGAEDEASVDVRVDREDGAVGVRRHDELVDLRVVRPEVPQAPGHGQEGDLVDRRRPTHGALVTHFRTIPHHSRHPCIIHPLLHLTSPPGAIFKPNFPSWRHFQT